MNKDAESASVSISAQLPSSSPGPQSPAVDSGAEQSTTSTTRTGKITDHDFPKDTTLFLGDLEPWMDEHYLIQVCNLFGWDAIRMHIPRPPAAANATRHPNNAGYAILIMSSPEAAERVWNQYGPEAPVPPQPILLPNSNRSVRIELITAPSAQTAIGKELGPVDNAIEYSIFVGDLAADVTNADLMNVFRNPNLGLRGDFPPRLIAPFHSCCNAKVMVDSFSGVSKGYGFVRFTSEADQQRALVEMQGLYCKSRPMRLSHATAKNKAVATEEEATEAVVPVQRKPGNTSTLSPSAVDSTTLQRLRSVTSTVADSQLQKNNYRNELHPSLVARIAQLSNTMAQHGQHRPQGPYPQNGPSILPPPGLTPSQIQNWANQNPHTRTVLEHLLGGATDPTTPSDPLNTTVFVGGLSPLISEDTLRTFFAPFGPIHYVKVPPGKSCGFVQFVRKADAERAIEALSGYSIGGSKVRLSWGRNRSSAAPTPSTPAAPAPLSPQTMAGAGRYPPNTPAPEGPLSNDQVNHIIERLQDYFLHNGQAPGAPGAGIPSTPAGRNLRPIPPVGPAVNPLGTPSGSGYGGYGGVGGVGGPNGGGYMGNNLGIGYGPGPAPGPGHNVGAGYPPPMRGDFGRNDFGVGAGGMGYHGGFSGYPNAGYGGLGIGGYGGATGPSVLEEQLVGTYGTRLQRPGGAGGYGGQGHYDELSLDRGSGPNSAYGGYSSGSGLDGNVLQDRFPSGGRGAGGVGGLGVNGGGLGPGSFGFEDASPQFPATDILRQDTLYSLPRTTSSGPGSSGPVSASGDNLGRSTGGGGGVGGLSRDVNVEVEQLPALFSSFRMDNGRGGAGGGTTASASNGTFGPRY